MLMVTNSFVVIVLNSFLLLITEEVHEGTRQRTISTCVMYLCITLNLNKNRVQVLTEWSLTRT